MYISLSSLHVGHSRPLSNESKEKRANVYLIYLLVSKMVLGMSKCTTVCIFK